MNSSLLKFLLALGAGNLLIVTSLVGCTANEERSIKAEQAATPLVANTSNIFKMRHRANTRSEVAQAASQMANVLLGENVDSSEIQAAAATAPKSDGSFHFALKSRANVKISYGEDKGEITVINEDVTNRHEFSTDIGDTDAESRFVSASAALISAGTPGLNGLDTTAVVRKKIMEGEKTPGGTPIIRVKEYLFVAPLKLNGLPVLDAGLTVSVDRSGALARVMVFGPEISSPTSGADSVALTVDGSAADQRARGEFASSRIEPLGLGYWLPQGQGKDVQVTVEPRYLYLIYSQVNIGGKAFDSLGRYVAYSASNSAAKATVWPLDSTAVSTGDLKP